MIIICLLIQARGQCCNNKLGRAMVPRIQEIIIGCVHLFYRGTRGTHTRIEDDCLPSYILLTTIRRNGFGSGHVLDAKHAPFWQFQVVSVAWIFFKRKVHVQENKGDKISKRNDILNGWAPFSIGRKQFHDRVYLWGRKYFLGRNRSALVQCCNGKPCS